MKIHAIILCWTGQEENARNIARSLVGHVHRLTVIDGSESPAAVIENCEWIKIAPESYCGGKVEVAFKRFDGDLFLQIAADLSYSSWPQLVRRCVDSFTSIPSLGIWAPDIYYTPWVTDDVVIARTDNPEWLAIQNG